MEIAILIALLLVGTLLILVEIFLIPGISLAGIAGVVFIGGAIYVGYAEIGGVAGHLTLVGSVVLLGVAIWIFVKARALERLALKTDITGKNEPLKDVEIAVGDVALTVSRLAPMGKIRIGNNTIEAKTNDDFIDENTEVRIAKIFSTNVLVERVSA
jgi:membrane-bound ClpP family serine protease